MTREEAVFNGVPAWLLADYLNDMGGEGTEGVVAGDGWTATLDAAQRPANSTGLGRVTVTIEGPGAKEAMATLRVKARRGGG